MRKVLEVILCIFAGIFLFGTIAITVQVIGDDSSNKASIIGGILSMIGGAIGALGAYAVASHQMSKQIEHEKKKEERQKKENILHNLVILKRLNDEAMEFVRFFIEQHSHPQHDTDLRTNIRFREKDLFWIVNNVNSINYEILREGYITDYLSFSREINNMYIDVEELERIPDSYLSRRVIRLREIILIRNENFILFDKYLKDHINIIQKQIEGLV